MKIQSIIKNFFLALSFFLIYALPSHSMHITTRGGHVSTILAKARHYGTSCHNNDPFVDYDKDKIIDYIEGKAPNIKTPICNYKHVIGCPEPTDFPKLIKGKVRVAIVDSGLKFDLEQTKNLNLTRSSEFRAHLLKNDYDDIQGHLHTLNICTILNEVCPGFKLDIYSIRKTTKDIGNLIGRLVHNAIDEKNHFINISYALSYRHNLDSPLCSPEGLISDFLIEAFMRARNEGVGIILAAGNDRMNIICRYPGFLKLLNDMEGALLVVYGTSYNWCHGTSFVQPTLVESTFEWSNYCDSSDVAKNGISAPASGLYLYHDIQGSRAPTRGTSFAAPQVTAAAAILKAMNPDLSPIEIFKILNATKRTDPLFTWKYHDFSNIPGVLNVKTAMKFVSHSQKEIE